MKERINGLLISSIIFMMLSVKYLAMLFLAYGVVSLTGLFTIVDHPWFMALVLIMVAHFLLDWFDYSVRIFDRIVNEKDKK